MSASSATLVATGIRLTRGEREILRGVDFAAKPGQVTLLTGRSGSGKSSLLALLAGPGLPDHGRVCLGEREGHAISDVTGIVLQGYGLVSLLTAMENVEIALYARGWSGEDAREKAREMLHRLGLDEVREHLIERMSGGQQQRVAVARALAPNPQVLLADEPTAELDVTTRHLRVAELATAARRGATVVRDTRAKDLRATAPPHMVVQRGKGATQPSYHAQKN